LQISHTADKNLNQALSQGNNRRSNVLYADAITLLFEGIARVVETHQPLVETFYGKFPVRNGMFYFWIIFKETWHICRWA
jgi:hypothetical protein